MIVVDATRCHCGCGRSLPAQKVALDAGRRHRVTTATAAGTGCRHIRYGHAQIFAGQRGLRLASISRQIAHDVVWQDEHGGRYLGNGIGVIKNFKRWQERGGRR